MDDSEGLSVPNISMRGNQSLYIEYAKVSSVDYALTFSREVGRTEIPVAQLHSLYLGPGTSISHAAINICAEYGVVIIWTGGSGLQYYAHGQSLASSSRYAVMQAELVADPKKRLAVAKQMYQMRFPDEIVHQLSMEQLRGREGVRVKKAYTQAAHQYGIEWTVRKAQMERNVDDPVNQAITFATANLYGIVTATINAIGAIPSLGFVHTGHRNSFVFDIADLYKTSIAVPIAFAVASNADYHPILGNTIRAKMRQQFHEYKLGKKIIADIQQLFKIEDDPIPDFQDLVSLWESKESTVVANKNWADEE